MTGSNSSANRKSALTGRKRRGLLAFGLHKRGILPHSLGHLGAVQLIVESLILRQPMSSLFATSSSVLLWTSSPETLLHPWVGHRGCTSHAFRQGWQDAAGRVDRPDERSEPRQCPRKQ